MKNARGKLLLLFPAVLEKNQPTVFHIICPINSSPISKLCHSPPRQRKCGTATKSNAPLPTLHPKNGSRKKMSRCVWLLKRCAGNLNEVFVAKRLIFLDFIMFFHV